MDRGNKTNKTHRLWWVRLWDCVEGQNESVSECLLWNTIVIYICTSIIKIMQYENNVGGLTFPISLFNLYWLSWMQSWNCERARKKERKEQRQKENRINTRQLHTQRSCDTILIYCTSEGTCKPVTGRNNKSLHLFHNLFHKGRMETVKEKILHLGWLWQQILQSQFPIAWQLTNLIHFAVK